MSATNGDVLVSKTAYWAIEGVFFGLALVAAVVRISVRLFKFRRLFADDYLVGLALLMAITCNGLFFAAVPSLYLFMDVALGRARLPANYVNIATGAAIYASSAEILAWATIGTIKLSFLLYFRSLVQRLPRLMAYWRIVFIVCFLLSCSLVPGAFITCPYVGSDILTHCVGTPAFLQRERILLIYSTVSDIVTDLLVMSIPILLLRKVRLRLRQRLSICAVLCLSIFMIVVACVRGISGSTYRKNDQIWLQFWVQLEVSISVLMASLVIFRTLFVGTRGSTPDKHAARSSDRLWKRKKAPELSNVEVEATMTGMRTLVRENGRTTFGGSFGTASSSTTYHDPYWDAHFKGTDPVPPSKWEGQEAHEIGLAR